MGVAATAVADRRRWIRDLDERNKQVRREAYTDFLTALTLTTRGLRAVARGLFRPDLSASAAAGLAFEEHQLGAAKQRLHITSPVQVIAAADAAYQRLHDERDRLAAAATRSGLDGPEMVAAASDERRLREVLVDAMRSDLDV